MPIYEYFCNLCQSGSSFLLLRISEPVEPYCKHCGNRNVEGVVSPVVVVRSVEKRMESISVSSSLSALDETDPRSIERL